MSIQLTVLVLDLEKRMATLERTIAELAQRRATFEATMEQRVTAIEQQLATPSSTAQPARQSSLDEVSCETRSRNNDQDSKNSRPWALGIRS